MSSGTVYESDAGKRTSRAVSGKVLDEGDVRRIARLGMTPRQQELNRLWAYYCAEQYATRKVGWDGKEHVEGLAHEAIATAGFIPSGFYDAGATLPLRFRRPTTPYQLVRVIINRFTGLLFSERRSPKVRVEGDPLTEDYLRTVAELARLWPALILARTYGGAMGSVALGFQFVDGKPLVEVHDPRWCYPVFKDRHSLALASLEIRYIYPEEAQDPKTGVWVEVPYWYRRTIDDESDIVYEPEPVGDGEEPAWRPAVAVAHGLGECTVVWVQNIPVQGQIDGETDCHGCYDMVEGIDALLAMAHRGVLANCDPTIHVSTDLPLAEVRKGSENALKTEKGGSVAYVEIAGTGPKAAQELANDLRGKVLEVTQCILEQDPSGGGGGSGGGRTATEVRHKYASMVEKADVLREQYGEHGVKRLLSMMERAIRKLSAGAVDPATGQLVRSALVLPPKHITDNGEMQEIERRLGHGGVLALQWPPYFEPSLQDILQATQAAAAAKAASLIDDEVAMNFISSYFNVEDVHALLAKVRDTAVKQQADLESMALGAMPGSGGGFKSGGRGGVPEM